MEYINKFDVIGKGTVYVVKSADCVNYNLGDTIIFDDTMLKITGFERSVKLIAPPVLGDTIGIICQKIDIKLNFKKYLLDLETRIIFVYDENSRVYRGLNPSDMWLVQHTYNLNHKYVAHNNIFELLQKDDMVVYIRKNGEKDVYMIDNDVTTVDDYGENYVADGNKIYGIDNETNSATFILKLEPNGNYKRYEIK